MSRNLRLYLSDILTSILDCCDFGDRYPQVEWRKIAGLRDMIAHAYFTIDDQIVWDIVQNKLDDLHQEIKQIIAESI